MKESGLGRENGIEALEACALHFFYSPVKVYLDGTYFQIPKVNRLSSIPPPPKKPDRMTIGLRKPVMQNDMADFATYSGLKLKDNCKRYVTFAVVRWMNRIKHNTASRVHVVCHYK